MHKRKKIALVTSGYLPVPNVLGGAVESLDTMLLRTNEKYPEFDFTVYSAYAEKAEAQVERERFQCASFIFIKTPFIIRAIDKLVFFVAKYMLRKKRLMSYRYIMQRLWYLRAVSKALARTTEDYDYVILENHPTLFNIIKYNNNSIRYSGKVIYHLHNEVTNAYGCISEIQRVGKLLGVSNYINSTLNDFLISQNVCPLEVERQAVWRNCVDVQHFASPSVESRNSVRKKYNISERNIVFLFSGRLTAEKGAKELLRSFVDVAKKNKDVHLVIAGSFFFNSDITSRFERELWELSRQPQLQGRITFTGFVDYEKMPDLYAAADVCVMPSIWDDPAPLAIIESLAAGKPIITTSSGGIPEYVNGDCAIILNRNSNLIQSLTDAMLKLAESQDLREKMGNASRELGSRLTPMFFLRQLSQYTNE